MTETVAILNIRPSWNPAFSGSVVTGDPNRYYAPRERIRCAFGGNIR